MFQLVERIGKYDIVRELGRGATSQVYLGRDGFSGREVAIKVFDFANEDADARAKSMRRKAFIAEAGLVGRLRFRQCATNARVTMIDIDQTSLIPARTLAKPQDP